MKKNHEFLGTSTEPDIGQWTLENETRNLEQAGFQIIRAEEAFLDSIFDDIGAVVYFLKIISWQIPDFSTEKYRERLLALHEEIIAHGPFQAEAHRYLIGAQKR